jgi:hypothetical protein
MDWGGTVPPGAVALHLRYHVLWGARSLPWPVSCSDAPGSAVRHDDQPCPSVCSI